MGVRYLWVVLIALLGCQERIVETGSSSSAPSHCDSRITSTHPRQMSTLSLTSGIRTNVGKIKLDTRTLSLPAEDNSFQQLLPNVFVQSHRGFRAHQVGHNELVAVIDNNCTRDHGINTQTKFRKTNLNLSESLMTKEDEELQKPGKILRHSSRAFTVPDNMTIEELSQLVESDPCVTVVGNNALLRPLAVPNDPNYAAGLLQTTAYLNSVNFLAAYNKFFSGGNPITQDVVVAVIDSGTLVTHEDLINNIDPNGYNFVAGIANPSPQAWPGVWAGEEGHGTHVSGIIAAEGNNAKGVVGIIGTHGKIMGLNVFGDQPSATTANIDLAITRAVNFGAKVINMSLGGETYAASTQSAIQSAVTAGLVVVAAAGNGDDYGYGLVLSSSYGIYPAALAKDINGMLAVGSFDALTGDRSIFSNCSTSYVEISAPGAYDSSDMVNGGIPSTWSTANDTYIKKFGTNAIYGTSMASPVVAGAAALAMSLYKTNNGSFPLPAAVETALTTSSSTSSALTPYVKNGKALDLSALYDYVNGL